MLAAQWGEMLSNVAGRTTLGAKGSGGDGESLVRMASENRMQVLGHISLLGYEGEIIDSLSSGGRNEAAIGDPLESTMAAWAERCRQQGGLVVMPHAPHPQAERAADIVLGLVDAIEMMALNARRPDQLVSVPQHRLSAAVGCGSNKMDAASLLGGVRTYAQLGGRDFLVSELDGCCAEWGYLYHGRVKGGALEADSASSRRRYGRLANRVD